MENYDEIEEAICELKHYATLIIDIMVDSYKWKKLAQETDDDALKVKYKQVADIMYDLYNTEYEYLLNMYRS